jgi:hyperosmotically inducible periplasmic protein
MRIVKAAVVGAALLLAPLAARAGGASDTGLTTKSKVAVLTAVGTTGTDVHVDTVDGLVTLHGTVASAADKAAAEKAVGGIDGVKKVRNLLEVVAAKDQKAVEAADGKIAERVKKTLAEDSLLRNEKGIEVESVNAGTVLLSGKASTLGNHLRAIEIARGVPGVRRVASAIRSPDSKAVRDSAMGAAEKAAGDAEETTSEAKSSGASLSRSAKDAYITSRAKARLLADAATRGGSIDVDTKDGVVTLSGTVESRTAKTKAERDVAKLDGVRSVRNEIEVRND